MARKSRKSNTGTTAAQTASSVKQYSVALYARISVENERKRDADSIGNQIQLLKDFASEDPEMQVFDIYCDDDISGTDFIRPEFSRMMNDARDGKVNCIIVKDLSRFGRNYLETGEYIEMVLPFLQVRFIAITDQFDTNNKQADISVQLKNMVNERYARDISKKIGSTIKSMQRQGKFVGSKAPYGYLRDAADQHHLVIDPEAGPIVKEIFDMIADGCTMHHVAVTLNARGVPSPGRHSFDLGLVKSGKFENALWYQQTVRRVLLDQTYLGWSVGGKYRSDFYTTGSKKLIAVPSDAWIITKGTHEPIVAEAQFSRVQKYFLHTKELAGAATKYDCKSKNASIFRGHLRCGECGKAMFLRAKNGHGRKTWWYYCALHENYNSSYCPKKSVKKEDLESVTLRLLQTQMKLFTDAQALITALNQRESSKSRYRIYQNEIRATRKKIESCMALKAALYKEYAGRDISAETYLSQAQAYAAKADEMKIFLAELEKEARKYAPEYMGSAHWAQLIQEYGNRTELDAPMIDAFIDEIVLFNDGHYEVSFKYKDEMESVLLYASLRQKEAQRYVG